MSGCGLSPPIRTRDQVMKLPRIHTNLPINNQTIAWKYIFTESKLFCVEVMRVWPWSDSDPWPDQHLHIDVNCTASVDALVWWQEIHRFYLFVLNTSTYVTSVSFYYTRFSIKMIITTWVTRWSWHPGAKRSFRSGMTWRWWRRTLSMLPESSCNAALMSPCSASVICPRGLILTIPSGW